MLRPYLAVLGARYREVLQYRSAALANSVVQLFWGGIRLMVLAAFFASANADPPMAFTAVVAYIWLGQAFFGLLPYSLDPDIQRKFLEGNVAWELLRPVNLYAFWYARTFAHRVADTTIRMLPLLFVALWGAAVAGARRVGTEAGRRASRAASPLPLRCSAWRRSPPQ